MKKAIIILAALFAANLSYGLDQQKQDSVLREFLWEDFVNRPQEKRVKVGLALSAGGTRAFAHTGVLEVLQDAALPVDMLSGTSMGAVIGSAFAADVPVEDIWQMGENMQLDNVSKDLNVMGVLKLVIGQKLPSSKNFENFLDSNLGGKYFEDLRIPFTASSMDIKTGEKVVFSSGPLALAVRASMNLPGVFEPVEYRQRQLVDGGVVDYLPIDAVRDLGAQYVIASLPLQDYSGVVPKTVAAYLLRISDIRGAILTEEAIEKANFALKPKMANIPVLEFEMLPIAGEMGVREMYRQLPLLQQDLILFNLQRHGYDN